MMEFARIPWERACAPQEVALGGSRMMEFASKLAPTAGIRSAARWDAPRALRCIWGRWTCAKSGLRLRKVPLRSRCTSLSIWYGCEINAAQLADSVAVDSPDPSAREADPLARLDDTDTSVEQPRLADLLAPAARPLRRVKRDFADAARTAANADWLRLGALGAGLVLASSALDQRADRFALDHAANRWVKSGTSLGDALPWLAIAGAGAAALDGSDPLRSRTGYAALEAGGTAFLAVTGLKYAFGRARPENGLGNHAFKPFSTTAGYDALPSGHSIISWAVVTPFAEEYNAPWLYGVAALTNLARVGGRKHWVSDTVAGSLLGYAIGKVFREASRAPKKGAPRVLIHPAGVDLAWAFN